jgi:histidine triad (HIT) family protein
MQDSIFTKIIKGEIPAHKIYEDDKTLALLDIHPSRPGHVLVVPKVQVDRLEQLSDEDYTAVLATARKVMQRVTAVFGDEYRACVKVEGFDVPHVHVHVIPCRTAADFWARADMSAEPDHAALAEMAKKLAF